MNRLTYDDVIIHLDWRRGPYVAAVKMSACVVAPDGYTYHLPDGATADLFVMRGGKCLPVRAVPLYMPTNGLGQRMCEVCGEPFVSRERAVHSIHVCSKACCRARHNAVSAATARAAYRPVTNDPRSCTVCGTAFVPKRSDAKTCSPRCRTAAHRARTLAATC
jgi:hypothetical protein